MDLPTGDDERVIGFGVMGLPFASGHYLAYRDFPATSFSPAYKSVWHRDPDGVWTFYATTRGPQSCSRFLSSVTSVDPVVCGIEATWVTPWSLLISVDGVLDWRVDIKTTRTTRLLSVIAGRMPAAAWTSTNLLTAMSRIIGPALRIGVIRLFGNLPNGQEFRIAPLRVWAVDGATAVLQGDDLGPSARCPSRVGWPTSICRSGASACWRRAGSSPSTLPGIATAGVLEYPADRGHGTAQNHHVSSSQADKPTRAELLAALSVAVDLGLGQPAEHMLRSALIATRLADRLALTPAQRDCVYYTTLIMWIGCHADSHEYARWFGDDIAVRRGSYLVDWSGLPYQRFLLTNVRHAESLLQRLKTLSALYVDAGATFRS
jgi:hypothetical protein